MQDVADQNKLSIRNYLHYSWAAFFPRFAATQLERNHDKLMQERGNERVTEFAHLHSTMPSKVSDF